jgi:hypothetical protein
MFARRTSGNLQKLVKLKHFAEAARPSLAAFMEHWAALVGFICTWMEITVFGST